MAVAAAMHDGVISASPPLGLRADPLGRAVAVRPMLHAALSLPDAAWSLVKAERQHLNKVANSPNPTLALALTLALTLTLTTDHRGPGPVRSGTCPGPGPGPRALSDPEH